MEYFLTNTQRSTALLSAYRNQNTPAPWDRTKTASTTPNKTELKKLVAESTGVPTKIDFTRTVQGVASPFFLVSPDAPSDRERLVCLNEFILNYKDLVVTAEAPVWCPFNSPALHRHIIKERLERSGLFASDRFVCNPVPGAGEMTAFKYTSTTPQHLVFPVGSNKINWLTVLRGSSRMGKALSRSKHLPNGPVGPEDGRLGALEMKRIRIWRAFDWIAECSKTAGMMRYEPFSVGMSLYDAEVVKLNPKSVHERSVIYLGDHFSRDTLVLSDMCCNGGKNSDLWLITDAVHRYAKRHTGEDKQTTALASADIEWLDALERNMRENDEGSTVGYRHNLQDAIAEYDQVGQERRKRMLDFANSVLTAEQRDSIFAAFSHNNEGTAAAFIDACVVAPCRSGVYLMLYSLLKLINFDVLNLIGYEAHRILVFKMFIPALLGVFLSNGGLGDVFENGMFNLRMLASKAGNETVGSILERSAVAASEERRSKNYAANDTATLFGGLVESTSNLHLAANMALRVNSYDKSREMLNVFYEEIIKVNIAKEKLSERQRQARRALKRRKRKAEEEEEEADDEEEEMSNSDEGENEAAEEGDDIDDGGTALASKTRKYLTGGRLLNDKRLLPPGLCLSTISNDKREVNVEDIQKLLSARQTKTTRTAAQVLEDCKNYTASKKDVNEHIVRCFLLGMMNILDTVFNMKNGSMLNSICANSSGVYRDKAEEQAILAESNESKVDAALSSPSITNKDANTRLAELIMDPPSLVGITDHTIIERTLQNEQTLRALMVNPVFTSIVEAENGDVGRYVVLSNIVKFMSITLSCLVDGDMPILMETRKNVNTAIDRGKAKHVKKSGNIHGTCGGGQLDSYDYREAGYYPVGQTELRKQLLPPCIHQLKSIATQGKKAGRVYMSKQTCEHAFCKMLKFLYYSLDATAPSRGHNFFIDKASRAILFRALEHDKKNGVHKDLTEFAMRGSESWMADRDYTKTDKYADNMSAVDFFSDLKMAMIDEGIVASPKPSLSSSRPTPETAYAIYQESMNIKCEAYRPKLYKRDEFVKESAIFQQTPEGEPHSQPPPVSTEKTQQDDGVNSDRRSEGGLLEQLVNGYLF